MKILMLGAGGVGGYFGGRLVQAGADVTFLVREGRAAQLRGGLRIESPNGDATIPVKVITADAPKAEFDVIILSCKAYGLTGALEAIAPFVREGVAILPLLNGFGHLKQIEARFPDAIVWGGIAGVAASLTEDGVVRQMLAFQTIGAGVRAGRSDGQATLESLVAALKRAGIDAAVSDNVERAMWEKWCFLATLAASTCLMRAPIGEILATDHGETLITGLFEECNRTASAEGWTPAPKPTQDYRDKLLERGSNFTASMMRDMESGHATEADHIIGDMIARARRHGLETPLLQVAYSRLQIHETRRRASGD
ncbi:ketopantoate reductase family protein [Pikeienuella piscinae]|uniref:2-dehydropantoate 2-reductase n=2 Tax=Pikeienuella piscinae TaxID=2748098 RepID=A0A7M3T6T2_9RHOB|nr:ketopantoate reductase family protein [Pikeienuella piscinae]